MKTTLLFIILGLCIASSFAQRDLTKSKSSSIKVPRDAADVVPQWTCDRLNTENVKAKEAKANGTKCQYLEYMKQVFTNQYTTPQYPQCYAQMDGQCADKIGDYYEKKNIKTFSASLTVYCKDAQWDDFITLLETFQAKFEDAFTTDYWNCVHDKAQEYADNEYVTFPEWPAPFLDVMNYVCQGIEAGLRNAERVQFQDFFDSNDSFTTLDSVGSPLWKDIQGKLNDADLNEDLKACLVAETGYFSISTVPEVEGAYSTKEQAEDEYDQAYLFIEETEELSIPYNEDEEGYECWNYYAPKTHYHQSKDVVAEDGFNSNRGHPLCPPNTIYEPLSFYGPICCPIHPVDFRPRTYNCCFESLDLPQLRSRGRTMNRRAACYGCTCLKGYEMDTQGDFWDTGDSYGACTKKTYEE